MCSHHHHQVIDRLADGLARRRPGARRTRRGGRGRRPPRGHERAVAPRGHRADRPGPPTDLRRVRGAGDAATDPRLRVSCTGGRRDGAGSDSGSSTTVDLDAYAALCADPPRHGVAATGRWTRARQSSGQLAAFRDHWTRARVRAVVRDRPTRRQLSRLRRPRRRRSSHPSSSLPSRSAGGSHTKRGARAMPPRRARAALDVAFGVLALDHLVSITRIENRRSWHLMEKLGMAFERDAVHAERGTQLIVYGMDAPSRMERVVEPELMLDAEQARAYSEADFSVPHQAAIERFASHFPDFDCGRVLDLACGPGRRHRSLRPRAYPAVHRASGSTDHRRCSTLGRERVADAGLTDRESTLERARVLPDRRGRRSSGPSTPIVCTSALHHFHDPATLWDTVRACARPGAAVLVQDLMRPVSVEVADALVARVRSRRSRGAPARLPPLAGAAFTVDEVRAQLDGRLARIGARSRGERPPPPRRRVAL